MEADRIRLATAADLRTVASLVVESCADPAAHCLHSWSGESSEETAVELAACHGEGELVYVLAERAAALIGAQGCEFDRALGRGWLLGPHVREDWAAVADLLLRALLAALPADIAELAAFLNAANERAIAFYRRHGFVEDSMRHHEFQLLAGSGPAGVGGTRLEACHRPSFFELFETLFPRAYYSPDRLIQMQGESHEVFVALAGECVDGFCVASRTAGEQRGEIQFLGVREARRRQGLARELIAAGITWLRSVGVGEIALSVADEKAGARRLYREAGFELRYSGVALRLQASSRGD